MEKAPGERHERASPPFTYGGQAVIEGVMIRGRRAFAVAVRKPDGGMATRTEPLSSVYTGPLRRIPLVRGVIVLAETMALGMKALGYSTNVSLEQEGQELGRWGMGAMLVVALGFVVGLFFVLPLVVTSFLDRSISSDVTSNVLVGLLRLAIFLAYVGAMGLIPDIRRVFAYHGAEHMAVLAYEAGEPLEPASVFRFPTAHPRCGTAFLLVVMVVAIAVFAFLGRPPLGMRILSHIVLIPVIAGLSYEVIRFSGAHRRNPLVRLLTSPSLALQALTTRQPDMSQVEVAIHAIRTAIAADEEAEG